jgi:hypothetical protein
VAGADFEALARASLHWSRVRGYHAPDAWVRRVALNYALSVPRGPATGAVRWSGWPNGPSRRPRRTALARLLDADGSREEASHA